MLDLCPSVQSDADCGGGNKNRKKGQTNPPREPNVLRSNPENDFQSNSSGSEQSQIQRDSRNKRADVETKVEKHQKRRQADICANHYCRNSKFERRRIGFCNIYISNINRRLLCFSVFFTPSPSIACDQFR